MSAKSERRNRAMTVVSQAHNNMVTVRLNFGLGPGLNPGRSPGKPHHGMLCMQTWSSK